MLLIPKMLITYMQLSKSEINFLCHKFFIIINNNHSKIFQCGGKFWCVFENEENS